MGDHVDRPSGESRRVLLAEELTRIQSVDVLGGDPQLASFAAEVDDRRDSVGTDGSAPVGYSQSFSTPWLALAATVGARDIAYISWGQGVESEVTPNRPTTYANAGQVLPALKSRQLEAGWKHRDEAFDASIVAFDIARPASDDILISTGRPASIRSKITPSSL